MNIIGISAFYHDSACCLLQDRKLIAAAQEERFSRRKNDPDFPIQALRFCMKEGRITINDIDCIAYYEDPAKKLERQIWSGQFNPRHSDDDRFDPGRPLREITERFGYQGVVKFYDHHKSHAASSFYYSGFEEAAIMTVDGVGEWTTTTFGVGNKTGLFELFKVEFPNSVGLLYSAITNYLGFEVNEGEYKIMGLAPYGYPKYLQKFDELLQNHEGFDFRLNMEYFDFANETAMFTHALCDLFGNNPRQRGSALEQFHMNVAASLQRALENFMVKKTRTLRQYVDTDNLCLSGGVALNCVANRTILNSGSFKKLFTPPGSNDAGCAIGAATLAALELDDNKNGWEKLSHAYLGPEYESDEVLRLLDATGLVYTSYQGNYSEMIRQSAEMIAGGSVVGWFQGKMEFGPRALGARSILADPRNPDHRRTINSMIKKREGFRPFAPTVIEERAFEFFEIDHPSPFMLETCPARTGVHLPAVTHVDGSARVQTIRRDTNPRYYDLIAEFGKITGYPVLLNTSFNVNKEPIVCSPIDALKGFVKSNIDALIIADFIIERKKNVMDELQVKLLDEEMLNRGVAASLYTFI